MGFPGTRERGVGGGNEGILGTAKAPARQDAVPMMTKAAGWKCLQGSKEACGENSPGPNNLAWLPSVSV